MTKKRAAKKSRTCKNPSKKGGAWEREASASLSLWISKSFGDLRDDLIWRSAGSGSRASTARKQGKSRSSHAGDLCATDGRAQKFMDVFLIECKAYRNLKLDGLFWLSSAGNLSLFFDKPIEQAREHRKWPMLLLKQNQRAPLIVLPRSIAKLATSVSALHPVVTFARSVSAGFEFYAVFHLADFLQHVPFQAFSMLITPREFNG